MRINKRFDYADFGDPEYQAGQEEFGEVGGTSRKSWEFVTMSLGLKQMGVFNCDKLALGTGCLKENIIYYYANRFKHTIATDIAYYPDGDRDSSILWGGEGYSISEVLDSPLLKNKSTLTARPMDMRKLDVPDESMDVIWSSSSVEHSGGLADVIQCVVEAQRALKLGGIFAITSEWNLTPENGIAIRFANVQSVDDYVLGKIAEATPNLELVEPLSLERSDHPKNLEKEYMLGKTNRFYGNIIDYTSIQLFWRKV